jgi:hypothetical protein
MSTRALRVFAGLSSSQSVQDDDTGGGVQLNPVLSAIRKPNERPAGTHERERCVLGSSPVPRSKSTERGKKNHRRAMMADEEIDRLRHIVDTEERKLRQLKAIHEDIVAGRLPDQDQVIALSVTQDYPNASVEVREAVKAERLERVEYGKMLAEFHAGCVMAAVVAGNVSAQYGAAMMRTFLAGPYGWSTDPLPILTDAQKSAMLEWIYKQLATPHEKDSN